MWNDSFLASLGEDGENNTVQKVEYLFTKFSLGLVQGQSVYILPAWVRNVQRITWQGYKVHPISFREMCELTPSTMVIDESTKYEAPMGRPLYYCLHPSDVRNIRFYPTPNEDLAIDDSKVWTRDGIGDICCVACYRSYDGGEFKLPEYISRRTLKAFILGMAFLKEGKGQNLRAYKYYDGKYEFCLEILKRVNSLHFLSRRYRLSDTFNLDGFGKKPHRPVLPPNFSRNW